KNTANPPSPSLNRSVEEAGQAMVALTRRATDETVGQTRLLLPLVLPDKPLGDSPTANAFLEPPAESLRDIQQGMTAVLEPLAALAWIVLATPPGRTAPRDELLRLVPGDVGFCLLIEDVRGHAKALLDSPFVSQFRASPMAKLIDANETQKLTLADQFLQQYLQISAQQLRDDVLGDALVLAYRPGPPESPDK